MTTPFTIIIPGLPPITNFENTNGMFHCDIPNPQNIQYITFVLMTPLPENTALALNYSVPPYTALNYIGALTNTRTSDTFSTGWGMT